MKITFALILTFANLILFMVTGSKELLSFLTGMTGCIAITLHWSIARDNIDKLKKVEAELDDERKFRRLVLGLWDGAGARVVIEEGAKTVFWMEQEAIQASKISSDYLQKKRDEAADNFTQLVAVINKITNGYWVDRLNHYREMLAKKE